MCSGPAGYEAQSQQERGNRPAGLRSLLAGHRIRAHGKEAKGLQVTEVHRPWQVGQDSENMYLQAKSMQDKVEMRAIVFQRAHPGTHAKEALVPGDWRWNSATLHAQEMARVSTSMLHQKVLQATWCMGMKQIHPVSITEEDAACTDLYPNSTACITHSTGCSVAKRTGMRGAMPAQAP
eukprot:1161203-Pelagomonas_calceolata.AAC.1